MLMPNNTIAIFSNNTIEIFGYYDLLAMRYYLSIIYDNSSLMTFNVIIGGISGRNGQ